MEINKGSKDGVYVHKEYKYGKLILKIILNYVILVLIALAAGYYTSIKYKYFLRDDKYGPYIFVISLLTIYYWMIAFRNKFILDFKLIITPKAEGENELFIETEYVKYIFVRRQIKLSIKMSENQHNKALQFDCRKGIMIINNKLKLMFYNNRHCKEVKEKIEAL